MVGTPVGSVYSMSAVTCDHARCPVVVASRRVVGIEHAILGGTPPRRDWIFARYDALEIDVEDWRPIVAKAHRTPIFEAIRSAQAREPDQTSGATRQGRLGAFPVMATVDGSTVPLLVEVKGLEPSASTLRNQDGQCCD